MFNRGGSVETTDIAKYLKETHNVQLMKLQDESTISALADPKQFIKDRQKNIDLLYADDGTMVATYKTAYDLYKSADFGLPEKEAHKFADEATEAMRVAHLKALETKYPGGYEKAMSLGALSRTVDSAIANKYDSNIVSETQLRAQIEAEVKGKYKGKKKVYKQKIKSKGL